MHQAGISVGHGPRFTFLKNLSIMQLGVFLVSFWHMARVSWDKAN